MPQMSFPASQNSAAMKEASLFSFYRRNPQHLFLARGADLRLRAGMSCPAHAGSCISTHLLVTLR